MKGPYLALDADFPDDESVVRVGERAAWMYIVMACWCRLHRTDGFLPAVQPARLNVPGWQGRLRALIDEGLVEVTDDAGYYLPAYPKWNPTEMDYQRRQHEGKAAACRRHHRDCVRDDCQTARDWLAVHQTQRVTQ